MILSPDNIELAKDNLLWFTDKGRETKDISVDLKDREIEWKKLHSSFELLLALSIYRGFVQVLLKVGNKIGIILKTVSL